MKTRPEIKNGEKVQHTGDLTIEQNIGEGAELTITDGSLIVKGSVAKGAKIKLISKEAKNGGVIIDADGSITVTGGSYASISTVGGVTYINGQRMAPSKALKISIEGSLSDEVTIESDAAVEVKKNIGERCYIKTTHGGLTANDVGAGTEIDVYGQIVARDISPTCRVTSESYGLNARNIGDEVSVKTYKDIAATNFGKKCILKSSSYGVQATTVGEFADIEAYKDIIITKVGNNSSLTSSSYGFQGGEIGKSVTVNTYKDINLQQVGESCRLTSSSYGITVSQYVDNNAKMKAYKDIHAARLGNGCSLTSDSYGVTIADAGDSLSIDAYKSVIVKNVGRNATLNSNMYEVITNNLAPGANIRAYKDIVINGICPTDAKTVSSMGKVRKNGPIKELSFFASKSEEKKSVSANIPEHFICPLSKKLMMSPVIFSEDGETYEESAIKKRMREMNYSSEKISELLTPNQVLVSMISKYLEAHPEQLAASTRKLGR